MKLHIPGLPQIVQYAFDTLLNKGIGWDNLSDEVRGILTGIVFDSTIPLGGVPGFIPALGAPYLRADYPYFWSRIQAGGNIVNDFTWQSEKRYGSYSYGDGKTTFRVPFIVDFVRGFGPTSGQTMGQWVEDTLQQMTGSFVYGEGDPNNPNAFQGVFARGGTAPGNTAVVVGTDAIVTFDASRVARTGTETAPKHVLLPKYIYTGEVW